MSSPQRKICAFIQTYSDNREILFRFHDVDQERIAFLNSFDKTFFAFHNCSESYRARMLQRNFFQSLTNLEIITYSSIPYPQTLLQTLLRCYRDSYEYIVFLQDDVFTYQPGNLQDLSQLIKTAEYKFLSLETNNEDLQIGDERIVVRYGDTKLYRAQSQDYSARGMYACDDGAYAGAIDFLMGKVYTFGYFQCDTIWTAENHMNDHVTQNPIERYCTNFRSFKRYNIVGGNIWNKDNDLKLLNTRFATTFTLSVPLAQPSRKICAFMQTYSDSRELLFRIHNVDSDMIQFLNSFDRVYISFHNCSTSYREKLLKGYFLSSLRNLHVLIYDSIPYPQTFKLTLDTCKQAGFEYLVFLQDDVFSYEPGPMNELVHILKNADYSLIALEESSLSLSADDDLKVYSYGATSLYKTSSRHFEAKNLYACDDGTYAGRIEYLLEKVYPPRYYTCPHIWDAETEMNLHIQKNPIERFCTNFKPFKRYNIIGHNILQRDRDIEQLNERFGLSLRSF